MTLRNVFPFLAPLDLAYAPRANAVVGGNVTMWPGVQADRRDIRLGQLRPPVLGPVYADLPKNVERMPVVLAGRTPLQIVGAVVVLVAVDMVNLVQRGRARAVECWANKGMHVGGSPMPRVGQANDDVSAGNGMVRKNASRLGVQSRRIPSDPSKTRNRVDALVPNDGTPFFAYVFDSHALPSKRWPWSGPHGVTSTVAGRFIVASGGVS